MHHLWPIVAHQFNITLMERSKIVRPQKKVEGEGEGGEGEANDDAANKKDKKKKKKKKRKKKAKKKKKGGDDDGPPPIEDINLSELAPKLNPDFSTPPIQGIILVGYPNTKDQVKALKEFGVKLD